MEIFIVVALILVAPFVLFIVVGSSGFRIIQQYEKGVVFRLGKFSAEKEPGFRWIIPIVDRLVKVDMRIVTMPVQSQKIITKDNVSIDVAAVAYYNIVSAADAVIKVNNISHAIYEISQTTIRNITGQFSLDETLSQTAEINLKIKEVIDAQTEHWGVLISIVEIKDIQLPDSMQRAMAREAEAEREKRAKIIAAEGELLAVDKLSQAADQIEKHPVALQLRSLQTLSEIAVEKNSTIIFPTNFMSTVSEVKKFIEGGM